jgi:hypothetical protein
MSVPRKTNLERLTKSQRKRRGRYLEAQRAKSPHRSARKPQHAR